MFNIGSVVAHVTADIGDFSDGLKKAESEAKLFGSRINGVAEGIQQVMKIAGAAAAGAFAIIGKSAIKYAGEYEQQKISLITLLGDEQKAEEHIAQIRKDALKTPFNVSGLVKANQLLISAGVEASKAEQDILNLGDAISANGKGAEELDRTVVNLQQIKNVGKATEMDMRQFAYNGINMYKLLADSTNLPMDKLKDMDISYEMISGALAKAAAVGGDYHDANLRQSASLQGLTSNLFDTAQQMLITTANETGLYDGTKKVVEKMTEFVTTAGPEVIRVMKDWGDKIKTATDFLIAHKEQVGIVAGILTVFFLPALIAVSTQLTINFITAVVSATWNVIMFGVEGWTAIYMLIAKAVQLGIATVAYIAHTAATIATTVATTAMTAATWLLNAALAVLTSPITLVIVAIIALIAAGVWLIKHWDDVKLFATALWKHVVDGWNSLVATVQSVGQKVLDAIMWPFNEAKKKIQEAVNWIKDRLDFTQRHSPSVVDIVSNGVKKVNEALGELNWSGTVNANGAGLAVSNGGNMSSNIVVRVDMAGAMIADAYGANQMAELMGDQILKRLQGQIRI